MSTVINRGPVHERLQIGLLLALNSGFVDSYTFQYHGERFASLQTGNVIQAGFNVAHGNFSTALTFFWPILFFAIGAAFNVVMKKIMPAKRLSQQQHSVLVELIGIAVVVLFAEQLPNAFFTGFLSFFLAIQLDAFPKIQGLPFMSVMSTGNIRNVGTNLMNFVYTRDRKFLRDGGLFLVIVLFFFVGAFISALLVKVMGSMTLLGSSVIVFVIFMLLFEHKEAQV
ncbi:MAG: DUF1275 domain-containing protein [Lactobacillaceae bacterium]|nr:DUF1275 domain-containing protein [Lactobacillaceae bacterium]